MKISDILKKQEPEKLERLLDSIVQAGEHFCPSCKLRVVGDMYIRCFGCQAKWRKVFNDCIDAGWPQDYSYMRADDFYPRS